MRNTRGTIIGLVAGVVLLAVVVGFAVGLPKADGESMPSLPDQLAAKVVAVSALTPQLAGATSAQQVTAVHQFAAQAEQSDAKGSKRLTHLYGDAKVRTYVDMAHLDRVTQGLPNEVAVSVVKTDPGLVFPSGPVAVDLDTTHYAMKKIDGFQCAGTYADAQQATATSQATGEQYGTSECRGEQNGYTVDVYASGTSLNEAAGYLKTILAA
ncbi:MAG: hypothetical protein FWD95_10130 [Nocardioidaceae bacterium]|nr:hypothetical protein [Nocardioidaceae bacterium]